MISTTNHLYYFLYNYIDFLICAITSWPSRSRSWPPYPYWTTIINFIPGGSYSSLLFSLFSPLRRLTDFHFMEWAYAMLLSRFFSLWWRQWWKIFVSPLCDCCFSWGVDHTYSTYHLGFLGVLGQLFQAWYCFKFESDATYLLTTVVIAFVSSYLVGCGWSGVEWVINVVGCGSPTLCNGQGACIFRPWSSHPAISFVKVLDWWIKRSVWFSYPIYESYTCPFLLGFNICWYDIQTLGTVWNALLPRCNLVTALSRAMVK